MRILSIDAGTQESGYVIMEMPEENELALIQFGKIENEDLLQIIKTGEYDEAVYEQFQCYGMPIGESTIEAITWNGRFMQSILDRKKKANAVYRKEEKMYICHSLKAKDANIRQALIDRFAKKDKKSGKGTKKEPDVFFGVKKDVWQAIAVGVTFFDKKKEEKEK